ncbi:hypothetical protein C4J81_18570 (plasmid) [Deltaproteobacteria bacterium Smac51]|nr:hypothetical protein C4J81_18570 [Deltaproteobacteria bacterium Smac51]
MRRVVYTSSIGYYDELKEPECPNRENIDFICFTDREGLESEKWQVRRVDSLLLGRVRDSRRLKILAHQFLPDYDQSLYMDNTVRLLRDPADILDQYLPEGVNFTCFRHPYEDCLYSEGELIIYHSADDEERVREQLDFYRRAGHPEHAGHFATTIVLRRHLEPEVGRLQEMWFAHVMRYSRRDQLSLPFLAPRCGVDIRPIEDGNVYDNPIFHWMTGEVRRLPMGLDPDTFLWLNPDLAGKVDDVERYLHEGGFREKRPHFHQRPLKLDMLANKHKSGQGRMYFNRHYYTRVYHQYLSPLAAEPFNLLETGWSRHGLPPAPEGAGSAPSLAMWSEFFPKARIIGLDRVGLTPGQTAGRAELRLYDGRLGAKGLAEALGGLRFRVIIADGSGDQKDLPVLFQHLEEGGFLFAEDLESGLSAGVREELESGGLEKALFYDSMDYKLPGFGADALAVMIKKS